jgi:hypothetical protein
MWIETTTLRHVCVLGPLVGRCASNAAKPVRFRSPHHAPFVYQLGWCAFIASKPGQHRQGVPIVAGSFSGRTALFEGVYDRFDSFTRFQYPDGARWLRDAFILARGLGREGAGSHKAGLAGSTPVPATNSVQPTMLRQNPMGRSSQDCISGH